MKNEKNKSYLPTKLSLIIRIAVAVYLLYTVYSLRGAPGQYSGGERILFLAFMVLFCAIAAGLCYFSVKGLLTGKYEGGALDINAGKDAAETESIETESIETESIETENGEEKTEAETKQEQ